MPVAASEPTEVLEALHELEKAPYLLETAVLILKLEGSWPDDPESVFLVHAELLVAILEFVPEYSIPWAVMAREPLSA